MLNHKTSIEPQQYSHTLNRTCVGLLYLLLAIFFATYSANDSAIASESSSHTTYPTPKISIIIDDIGYTYQRDIRAIKLPGAVSYAFLPHTPYSVALAELAHSLNKDILLHQPMQSINAKEQQHLGPGALTLEMERKEFIRVLQNNIQAIPHIIGINNHMGSLLTQHPGHMSWLMEAIGQYNNLFFVDSYTTDTSVVQKIANENWVLNIRRDVFLDNNRDPRHINHQFNRLLKTAHKNGIALAIAHPYPETLKILEQRLPTLLKKGYRLVPISELLNSHTQRFQTWRAFLSP